MTKSWQLPETENELTEVVAEALRDGPQVITQRGTAMAVVISYDEYRHMLTERQPLSIFFRQSPLVGVELDLARDKGDARDIDL